MTSQFASQTLSLGQLLANPYLIDAPAYQRTFAWTSEEADRLLDDLVDALDAEGEAGDSPDYFLGTMLFIDKDPALSRLANWPRPRASRTLEVVDGLQRLTTLTILFSVMCGLDAAQAKAQNERLMAAIRTGQGAAARPRLALREADETFFEPNVRAAGAGPVEPASEPRLPARERMLEVRAHFLTALADYDAAQRRRLADFLLDKCFIVLVATRNIDRAHRMFTVLNTTGKPLARNDILKASLLGRVPPAAAARATVAWDEAEARLGEDFESLFSHVRVMYGRPAAPVISGVAKVAGDDAETFIERVLRPAAVAFDDIRNARHSGSPHSEAIARSLTYLGWLPAADWVPPAMLWWMDRGSDATELAWFLGQLDRLAYGVRILGVGTKKRANRLGGVVTAIRNRQDLKASGSPLRLTREETRTIGFNLRDLHKRSPPMAKLVLLRLNDQIAGKPQGLPIKELTVEHLLPRKPSASSQWRRWFVEPAERERCTESLGNLVLVTRAQNDRAGNSDFERKKAVLFDTPNAPALPVNESVRRQTEWKAAQIEEREADLLWHLYELWQIGDAPQRASRDATAARGRPPRAATGA